MSVDQEYLVRLTQIAKQNREMISVPESNKTTWNSGVSLNWNDHFLGTPPEGEKIHGAMIHGYMEPRWEISGIKDDECKFTFKKLGCVTISHKDKCWVRDVGKWPEALRHEQGHFDITECFTRLFNKLASETMLGKVFPCSKNHAGSQAEMQVMELWDNVNEKRTAFQWRYEDVTENGVNFANQEIVEKEIAESLLALKEFSSN